MEVQQKELSVKTVKSSTKYKLVVEQSLEEKIRFLCLMKKNVEWSGVLFYKTEGTFEEGNFTVRALDVFLMDVGNAVFTSFKDTPEIASYAYDTPLLREDGIYEGLIHSHNNMATFFSATDVNTLKLDGSTQNHFVSLIVNNKGIYSAAVTRFIHRKALVEAVYEATTDTYYKSFEDKTIYTSKGTKSTKKKSQVIEDSYLEWFDLDIDKADCEVELTELHKRLIELDGREDTVYSNTYKPKTTAQPTLVYKSDNLPFKPKKAKQSADDSLESTDNGYNYYGDFSKSANKVEPEETTEEFIKRVVNKKSINSLKTDVDYSVIDELFCCRTLVSSFSGELTISKLNLAECKGTLVSYNSTFNDLANSGGDPVEVEDIIHLIEVTLPYVIMMYFTSITLNGTRYNTSQLDNEESINMFKYFINRIQSIMETYAYDIMDYNGNFSNTFDILNII